jgi:2-octaprenyl-6-methoxyphenol hydroxylase
LPDKASIWACATWRRSPKRLPDVLERYQRWRRFDTMTMGVATDGLNKLFSNRSDVLRLARDVGLGLVERIPALKQMFIREAAGFTGDVPKLLRGETL